MDNQYNEQSASRKRRKWPFVIIIVVLIVLIAGAAYVYYEHSNGNSPLGSGTQTPTNNQPSGQTSCSNGGQEVSIGNVSSCAPPIDGTVTSVSNTSITVQPSSGSSPETFTITNSTQFQGTGVSSANDIHVGDTVGILVGKAGSHVAIAIGVNPQGA